jgi:hypothetical protein
MNKHSKEGSLKQRSVKNWELEQQCSPCIAMMSVGFEVLPVLIIFLGRRGVW